MEYIRQYKMYALLIALVAVGVGIFTLVTLGYYPVAVVGSSFINAHQFNRNYKAMVIYATAIEKMDPASTTARENFSPDKIQSLVLEDLIEQKIIAKKLAAEAGQELPELIATRVNKFENDNGLQKAAEGLFGLSYDEFKEEVLIPQARRDILTGRLFLNGQSFDVWLKDTKKNTNVYIFSPHLKWDKENQTVEVK